MDRYEYAELSPIEDAEKYAKFSIYRFTITGPEKTGNVYESFELRGKQFRNWKHSKKQNELMTNAHDECGRRKYSGWDACDRSPLLRRAIHESFPYFEFCQLFWYPRILKPGIVGITEVRNYIPSLKQTTPAGWHQIAEGKPIRGNLFGIADSHGMEVELLKLGELAVAQGWTPCSDGPGRDESTYYRLVHPAEAAAQAVDSATAMPNAKKNLHESAGVAKASARSASEALDTLKKLGELRAAGFLTEEEFLAKKSDLLKAI